MATFLYISDTLVDLYEGAAIPIVKSVSDITNITGGSTKGNYSIPFKVPATKSNKLLFKFPELITNEAFDGNVELDTILEVDGTVILDGLARITQIQEVNGFIEYAIILFDGNSSWINALKGKKLSDLDFSEFDHLYDKNSIDQSEFDFDDNFYVYGLTNYGKPAGGTQYLVEDRLPHLKVHIIFRRIFTDAGYHISGDFIESSYFKKLFITPSKFPEITDDQVQNNKFRVTSIGHSTLIRTVSKIDFKIINFNTDFDSGGDVYFNTDNNDYTLGAAGKFTSNVTASMSFELSLGVRTETTGVAQNQGERAFAVKLFVNDVVKDFRLYTIPKTGAFTFSPILQINWLTDTFLIKVGDVVTIKAIASPFTGEAVIQTGALFRNIVFESIVKGMDVEMNTLMPEATQLDFISDIKELHNLYFYNDELTKTVIIEPRDDFYDQTPLDWSSKLDESRGITIEHLGANMSKEVRYRYKNDSNDKNIVLKEKEFNQEEPHASRTVSIDNVNAKDGVQDKTLKLFSSTWVGRGLVGAESGIIPIMWDNDTGIMPLKRSVKFNTRLLYFNGVKTLSNNETWRWEGTNRRTYPQFLMNAEGVQNSNSISFEDDSYGLGLFNRYWRDSHNTINNGRIFKVHLRLNAVDLANLDFRVPVYIARLGDGHYFHVKKLEYDANNLGTIKAELIKVLNNLAPVILDEKKGAVNYKIVEDTEEKIINYLTTKIPTVMVINGVESTVDVIYDVFGVSMRLNSGVVFQKGGRINKITV